MRDIIDLLIAAGGIWCGWWACDIHHHTDRQYRKLDPLPPYPVAEPPSNLLQIVEGNANGPLT